MFALAAPLAAPAPNVPGREASVPLIGVVIPAFKQPGLLPEAVESVLGQGAAFGVRTVLVNDGCPFEQTHDTYEIYARAGVAAFGGSRTPGRLMRKTKARVWRDKISDRHEQPSGRQQLPASRGPDTVDGRKLSALRKAE